MISETLDKLRRAGRVAAEARKFARLRATPGARLYELSLAVESEIGRLGADLAFPVQCSCNHVAAHFCPTIENDSVLGSGDLVKIDIGTHVDGWIADTAVTVNVGDDPDGRALVDAARAALDAGIAAARPRGDVREVSMAIERTIHERGFVPLRNLCGHGLGQWRVHAPPPIPNVAEFARDVLAPGSIVAFETFVSAGGGDVRPQGAAEIFRVDPDIDGAVLDREALDFIRSQRGLPFARRRLERLGSGRGEMLLERLARRGDLTRYPPLVQAEGRRVAQAEHTLYINENGIEVITL
ncbi:MAG: type II methionyl aminopeptidase [Vicinamibacteria bacterium]|nr:type II methionyl aminopeptidase [Vicinamibacteria bacterium]